MREATQGLSALVPLLVEVGDLKRVRATNITGSVAEGAFRRSWAALIKGEKPARVALRETAAAVCAARLGAIDAAALRRVSLSEDEARAALLASFDSVAGALPDGWREELRGAVGEEAASNDGDLPGFVWALEKQPRAGATRPGRGRLILEPPESHADHCATVAVYATLLSGGYEANAGTVFLTGLAHHLHNAALPDSGYAADQILVEHIERVQKKLQREALEQLPNALRGEVSRALQAVVGRVDSAEARAFQAADVLDRVLQMNQYARVASFTLEEALGEMDLVHPGPEQDFHLKVLEEAGLS